MEEMKKTEGKMWGERNIKVTERKKQM